MAVVAKADYQTAFSERKKEVRNLVLAGLEQIKKGKTKDFHMVCDRLDWRRNIQNEIISD